MFKNLFAVIFIFLLICLWACGEDGSKVKVNHVPENWIERDDLSSHELGYILKNDKGEEEANVYLFWGTTPSDMKDDKNDLIERVTQQLKTFYSNLDISTKFITIDGKVAGYAEAYDTASETYIYRITLVDENTYVDIYGAYYSIYKADIMSIINSITID